MGLSKDIETAFLNSMIDDTLSLDDLSPQQKKKLKTLSEDLSKAFVNFLVKQNFRVVEIETDLDVEQIKTSGDLDASVKPETTAGQYKPILDAITAIVPGASTIKDMVLNNPAIERIGNDGVKIPAMDLNKDFGQGGSLIVKGNGRIEESSAGKSPTPKSRKSLVKLFENELEDV